MDIERMKKLLTSGIEAGNKVKEVREVVKTYKTQKQDIYDDTAEIFKPSFDVQKEVKKTIDEKQNKIIEELQNNQEKLVKAIEFKPTNAITFDPTRAITLDGKVLPYFYESGDDESGDDESGDDEGGDDEGGDDKSGDDEGGDDEGCDDEEVKPSTSENKPTIINLDKGITDQYKNFLEKKRINFTI